MSRTLLHDWESSIERNTNNTEELLKTAEDIYNTAYARGKASEERPKGKWILQYRAGGDEFYTCSLCERVIEVDYPQTLKDFPFCHCGADIRGAE